MVLKTLKEPTLEGEDVSGVLVVVAATCNFRAAGVQGLRSEDVQELLSLLPALRSKKKGRSKRTALRSKGRTRRHHQDDF